jgi:hypothetical protein
VYVVAVDTETSMVPVDALIDKPAGELVNVPPGKPEMVGVGSVPFLQ